MWPHQAVQPVHSTWQRLWLVALLTWPWVNAFSSPPLPNVTPWLISWSCLALALLSWRHLQAVVIAQSWALAALVSSAMGVLQFFGGAELLAPAVHVPAYLGDAMGNLRQRNQLATLLAIGMLAVFAWRHEGLPWRHAVWMQAVLAIGLAATASRTGLLQLLFVGLWMVWHRQAPHGRQALHIGAFMVLVYGLASWVLPALLVLQSGQGVDNAVARMGSLGGCGSRQVLWSNVLHLIAQQPWTGWGWDGLRYAHHMNDYPGERFCDMLGNAHNLPLHLAFVGGVPLAVLAVVLVSVWVIRSRPWRHAGPAHQLAWGVLGVVGVHSLLEYPLWYGPFQVALVLAVWLLRGRLWQVLQAPRFRVSLGLGMLGLLAFAAYDHAQVQQIYKPAAQRWPLWRDQALSVAQRSWLFKDTALFAQVTITPVRPDNARAMLQASLQLMHTSPEPRVIEKLLDSAHLLGEHELYTLHRQRFKSVYPQAYLAWAHQRQH